MLPENFTRLHNGEEFLRSKCIEAIEASPDLFAHAQMVERSIDLLDYFSRQYVHSTEDQLTIQLLGIRLFNSSASALKLMMSGYYQGSAALQRDLLETLFLLDYFSTDPALISIWRDSDKKVRSEKFRPVKVRNALDARDDFTERKREKAYQLLCELAAHPTNMGFRMLTPTPGGNAHCGPFFELTALKAVLEELAKHLIQVGVIFPGFFEPKKRSDYEMKIGFLEAQGIWVEKFFGRPFDRRPVEELRALFFKVRDQLP